MKADLERLAMAVGLDLSKDWSSAGSKRFALLYFDHHAQIVRAVLTELRAMAFDDEQTNYDGLAVSVACDHILGETA